MNSFVMFIYLVVVYIVPNMCFTLCSQLPVADPFLEKVSLSDLGKQHYFVSKSTMMDV